MKIIPTILSLAIVSALAAKSSAQNSNDASVVIAPGARHFDLFRDDPRVLFAYTGMHWRRADRPAIRALHRRLDAYWARFIA